MGNYGNYEFREASVQYPKTEKAYAFFSYDEIPFQSATVGITNPGPRYSMKRSALFEVCVFEYVLEGEVEIFLDGEWKIASAGDFYILSPRVEHRYRSSQKNPCKKIWVNYVCGYMYEFLKSYGVRTGIYHSSSVKIYFDELLNIVEEPNKTEDTPFRVADLLHKIVKVAAKEKKKEQVDEYEMVRQISEYVYKKLNLDELAENMHMSKSNLIRKFKKQFSTTPYEYLIEMKLEAAKILLRDTQMTIKEISAKLAINDEHYFSSLFLKRVGERPLAYRRKESIMRT